MFVARVFFVGQDFWSITFHIRWLTASRRQLPLRLPPANSRSVAPVDAYSLHMVFAINMTCRRFAVLCLVSSVTFPFIRIRFRNRFRKNRVRNAVS